jgi:type IV secretory pathway VirB10-like protein
MAQSENIKRVQAEWNKLPQSEMACVNQKLSDRGDSVQSLARRGILPSDARVTELRSQCTRAYPAASQDQPSAAAKPSPRAAETPVQAEPAPEPEPLSSQAEATKADVTLYELRQTNERLKSGLENSAVQIAQLEKTKAELERAIKDAERARFDVENERGMIEETRVADKRKFDAALARLQAEKADALSKGRTWELFTYIATGGLIALLIILGSVLLAKWRRSTPPRQESKSKTTSLEPAAQAQRT